jgi:hypothetical protein
VTVTPSKVDLQSSASDAVCNQRLILFASHFQKEKAYPSTLPTYCTVVVNRTELADVNRVPKNTSLPPDSQPASQLSASSPTSGLQRLTTGSEASKQRALPDDGPTE